jgi:uncharacterized damage-inducible protein DinB
MELLTDRLFRHMAWANAYLFDRLAELSAEELQLTAPHDDWSAAAIAQHLTSAATRYAVRLDNLGEPNAITPTNSEGVLTLKALSTETDARLRVAAHQVEGFVEFTREGELIRRARATILAQSIHHATEHRAQIAGIFSSQGMKIIDLDAIDLWEFADYEGFGD